MVKNMFNTVKIFMASCPKILNDKKNNQYRKNIRANSVFQGKRELLKNLGR